MEYNVQLNNITQYNTLYKKLNTYVYKNKTPLFIIMGFNTTGAVHKIGIKNEINIVNYLNSHIEHPINKYFKNLYPESPVFKWEHIGGTKTKTDMVLRLCDRNIPISIKNHKTGTFDWINTTSFNLPDIKETFINYKKTWEDEYKISGKTEEMVKSRDDIINNYLNDLSSDQISSILNSIYIQYPEYIMVTIHKDKKIVMFSKEELKDLFCYNENDIFTLKSTRAKNSRQILKNGIKTNLRLRLTLNNGISALFGRGSCLSLKIQQDCVDKFIKQCTLVTGEIYTIADNIEIKDSLCEDSIQTDNIKMIKDSRIHDDIKEYLITMKGTPNGEDIWVNEDILKKSKTLEKMIMMHEKSGKKIIRM